VFLMRYELGFISQKTAFFIVTAVGTSNLTVFLIFLSETSFALATNIQTVTNGQTKTNSVGLVGKRTILTKRPPLGSENLCQLLRKKERSFVSNMGPHSS
jgi:hypothetical protein